MKKLGVFVLVFFAVALSFVSAQSTGSTGPIDGIANFFSSFYDNVIQRFAVFLLGDTVAGKPDLFFIKILIFLLLAFLVHYAANQFEPTRGSRAIVVSMIVSAISVRMLTAEWVEAIVLPYSALGIAVTVIIPLVLFFFFVEKGLAGQPALRKISWVFAAVIFFSLYFSRYDTPFVTWPSWRGPGQTPDLDSNFFFNPGHIYLYGALASLALLLYDKTIQRALTKSKYSNLNEINNIKVLSKLRREYNDAMDNMNDGSVTVDQTRIIVADIRKKARANGISQDLFELPGS